MKYINVTVKAQNAISIKRDVYSIVLDIILRYTRIICFTVSPYLDSIEELQEDIRYSKIIDSYIDSEFTESIHTENRKESLVYFKNDYFVREFLRERRDIFDFYDEEASINLEDVVFIGEHGIVCDTITHEQYCAVSDELLCEIEKKLK